MPNNRWHVDRTGFPYVILPESDSALSVFPITKYQLERWIADPAGPDDEWYEQLLKLSPRGSWRSLNSPYWQILATGLLPAEAESFARWLGPNYRLPEASEWRGGDRAIQQLTQQDLQDLSQVLQAAATPSTQQLIQRLLAAKRSTWGKLSFLHEGILEWVTRPHGEPGGLGRPSPDLPLKLILDPQAFDPVIPLKSERQVAFGARLMCTLRGRR